MAHRRKLAKRDVARKLTLVRNSPTYAVFKNLRTKDIIIVTFYDLAEKFALWSSKIDHGVLLIGSNESVVNYAFSKGFIFYEISDKWKSLIDKLDNPSLGNQIVQYARNFITEEMIRHKILNREGPPNISILQLASGLVYNGIITGLRGEVRCRKCQKLPILTFHMPEANNWGKGSVVMRCEDTEIQEEVDWNISQIQKFVNSLTFMTKPLPEEEGVWNLLREILITYRRAVRLNNSKQGGIYATN